LVPLFTLVRYSNSTSITTLGRISITANTTVITTASTAPIAPTDKVGIDKAVAAITDAEALATAEEALIEDLAEVDSGMEPDINKGSD